MFKFYEVGGKVRDELLGLESKDIDYVAVPQGGFLNTKIGDLFEVLFVYLEQNGYQIFLATKSCYTIRAKFPKGHQHEGLVADFVLARKEIGYKEGTREPIIVPGTLYDDLQRRDFTINAIARDEEGELYDPFDGLRAINERMLATPISGNITFGDDPLRLLRAIRFAITKKFFVSDEIRDILTNFDYAKRFHVVSEERIREELYKCFKCNTLETINVLNHYPHLRNYIFSRTNLWLKPTNEN